MSKGKFHVGEETGIIKCEGDSPPPDRIPEGWVETEPGVFKPQWPECRYRRLDIKLSKKKPIEITPICILNTGGGEKVTHDFCCRCDKFKPVIKLVRLTPEEEDVAREGDYLSSGGRLTEEELAELMDDLENVGDRRMENSPFDERKGKRRRPTPWVPCIYRREEKSEGCCPKYYCDCEACPLRRVNKADCKDCDYREESK
jgi:hypothetical protein